MKRLEVLTLTFVVAFAATIVFCICVAASPLIQSALIWFVVGNVGLAILTYLAWRFFRPKDHGQSSMQKNDIAKSEAPPGVSTQIVKKNPLATMPAPVSAIAKSPLVVKREQQLELIKMDWQSFRGVAFEKFLGKVFVANGCVALLTASPKEHGTDMVVTIRQVRYSVQVKSDGSRVGNSAIMQALAGMEPHHCSNSMVITNNSFSPAAIELARKSGTVLIDQREIEDLILGKHQIFS